MVLFLIRFGGSPSSQSQAASQTCEMTATSSTDGPDKPADSDSEEEDNKDDFDPFSSQDQTVAPPSKIYVNVATFVQYTIVSELVSSTLFFFFFFLQVLTGLQTLERWTPQLLRLEQRFPPGTLRSPSQLQQRRKIKGGPNSQIFSLSVGEFP